MKNKERHMKYQNTKTGCIFESDCECAGEDWVTLSPSSVASEEPEAAKEEVKEKPKANKRTKK